MTAYEPTPAEVGAAAVAINAARNAAFSAHLMVNATDLARAALIAAQEARELQTGSKFDVPVTAEDVAMVVAEAVGTWPRPDPAAGDRGGSDRVPGRERHRLRRRFDPPTTLALLDRIEALESHNAGLEADWQRLHDQHAELVSGLDAAARSLRAALDGDA